VATDVLSRGGRFVSASWDCSEEHEHVEWAEEIAQAGGEHASQVVEYSWDVLLSEERWTVLKDREDSMHNDSNRSKEKGGLGRLSCQRKWTVGGRFGAVLCKQKGNRGEKSLSGPKDTHTSCGRWNILGEA